MHKKPTYTQDMFPFYKTLLFWFMSLTQDFYGHIVS
jgi:hypothetical protein